MSLNNAGDRVTFVDPPAAVANSLGLSLRTAFPHRIANEQTSEDGIFTIILKSGINRARALFCFVFLLGHTVMGLVQVWAAIRICFWRTYSSTSMIWRLSLTRACHWRGAGCLGLMAAKNSGCLKVPSRGGPPIANDSPLGSFMIL